MKQEAEINTDDLVKLGSKRKWVPIWMWMNIIFRFGLYEVWPLCYLVYVKA